MKWLLHLYPRWWRKRYGEEFSALLEDTRPSPRAVLDGLLGALDAHFQPPVAPVDSPHGPTVDLHPDPPVTAAPRRVLPRPHSPASTGFESAVDQIIREARERGEFENLPGEGKPLDLRDDPWSRDWAMAFSILKQAGETLPWIALGREIDADKRSLQTLLSAAADELRSLRDAVRLGGRIEDYEAERRRWRTRYLEAAARLDEKLAQYNHQVPTFRLDRGRIPPHIASRLFDASCPPVDA